MIFVCMCVYSYGILCVLLCFVCVSQVTLVDSAYEAQAAAQPDQWAKEKWYVHPSSRCNNHPSLRGR